jgi:hypothetical protein
MNHTRNIVHYEAQIQCTDDGWWVTVTISAGGMYWTSKPAKLEASTEDEAHAEAERQVRALARAMKGLDE